MQCIACSHTILPGEHLCPRCKCPHYEFGDSPTEVELQKYLAVKHRNSVLQNLDFGIIVYRWKELDGNVFLDSRSRRFFGMGHDLLNTRTWLPDPFARIPGRTELTLELSVVSTGEPDRRIPITIPVPQDPQLLQLGIEIHDNLTVSLFLKNQNSETRSAPVDFLTM